MNKPWTIRFPKSIKVEVLSLLNENKITRKAIMEKFNIKSYATLKRWEKDKKEILGLKPQEWVKNINYNQGKIIRDILWLHSKNGFIDVDMTYSIGQFYKDAGLEAPKHKFDVDPEVKGVTKADCRESPLGDESANTVMYDPPFACGSGPSINNPKKGSNLIIRRFGCYRNIRELWSFYEASLREAHRILKDNGILIVKCQDTVSGGKNYFSIHFIHGTAERIGFCLVDKFDLLNNSRMHSGKWKVQYHARKHSSSFLVFKKTRSHISHFGQAA